MSHRGYHRLSPSNLLVLYLWTSSGLVVALPQITISKEDWAARLCYLWSLGGYCFAKRLKGQNTGCLFLTGTPLKITSSKCQITW